MTRYRTRNSVYEVDEGGKRARIVEPELTDWAPFDNAFLVSLPHGKRSLMIFWTSDDPFGQPVTQTSPVRSVEPALPLGV